MQSSVSHNHIGVEHEILMRNAAAVERSGLNRSEVEEVFFGNVLSAK